MDTLKKRTASSKRLVMKKPLPAWLTGGIAAMLLASPAMGADTIDAQKLAELDQVVRAHHPDLAASFYCVGRFTQHDADEYAIAARPGNDTKNGSYFVYTREGMLTKLSDFSGGTDVQCLTNEEAQKLNPIIQQSGMHGRIPDSHPFDTVCGFVEATTAVCWGYDEKERLFIALGGWIT